MGQLDWNVVGNLGNLLAAIFTGVASFISLYALIVSLMTSRQQQALSARIADEQAELMFEQVRMQRDSDVIAWSQRGIALLAEVEGQIGAHDPAGGPSPPQQLQRVQGLKHELSALIDQGRLFFPNQSPATKGADKPAAFQGHRQRILGVLVVAYNLLAGFDKLTSSERVGRAVERMAELRRQFVSEAQLAIDPRRYIAMKELNEVRRQKGIAPQTSDERDPSEAPRG